MSELKPCPFCGGEAKIKVQEVEYGLSGTIIKCNQCLATLYSPDKKAVLKNNVLMNKAIDNHTQKAIEAWNRWADNEID